MLCVLELEAEDWLKMLSIECLGIRLNDISMGEPDLLAAGVQCEHTGTLHTRIVETYSFRGMFQSTAGLFGYSF